MRSLVEHIVPGRWDDSRKPNQKELDATLALEVPIDETSAKVRTGPPSDDEEDYDLRFWAGLIPMELSTQPPIPDPRLTEGIEVPDYVTRYSRPKDD